MTDLSAEIKNVPDKLRMFSNGKTAEFVFAPNGMKPEHAWRWVLEMADGIDPYMPVRVGRDVHLIAVASIQWGRA